MLGSLSTGDDLGPLGDLGAFPPVGRPSGGARPGSPASIVRRGAATAIDLTVAVAVILLPLVALDRALGALAVPDATAGPLWRGAGAVWVLAFLLTYSPLAVSRWGATPGKRALGLEVVTLKDGARLGYGAAVVRHLANLVVTGIPVLCVANASSIVLSPHGSGLHDKAVGSTVIHRRNR
ncbi:RDD family protein [Streptomyces sp. NPDC088762]|uniref:RDD family protein n=1 Tax=Streptomyces sp. NPDC088762 TaxID=3365891 RepID=UPI0038238419